MTLFVEFRFFWLFFFSEKFSQNSVFFFPGKDYTLLTHSNFRAGKKKQPRKKKTAILLTHSIFPKKVQILIFSREIKKYDTFAVMVPKTCKCHFFGRFIFLTWFVIFRLKQNWNKIIKIEQLYPIFVSTAHSADNCGQ